MSRVRSVAARVGWLVLALPITFSFLAPAVHAQSSVSDSASRAPDEATLQFLTRAVPGGRAWRVVLKSGTIAFPGSVDRAPRFTPAGIEAPPSLPVSPRDMTTSLHPWQEIERIDVRTHSAKRGAVVGGVVVGLFSAALAIAVASDPFLGSGSGNDAGPVLAVTAMGVLAGAGVGALVGTLIPHWKHVYPRSGADEAERDRSWSSRGAQRR